MDIDSSSTDIKREFVRVPPFVRLALPGLLGIFLGAFVLFRTVQPDADWTSLNLSQILTLSHIYWIVFITGMTGFLLGVWVWALSPKSLPALLFALSGVATLLFTFSTLDMFFVVPSTDLISAIFNRINAYGSSAFGIIMCILLTVYPTRLRRYKILIAAILIGFGAWTLWVVDIAKIIGPASQRITLAEMMLIILLSIIQIRASTKHAEHRTIAIWLAACIIIGSGPFIALVALPSSFGYPPLIMPFYGFAFFNLVYVGFAIGLLRLRLFDLGDWAFQLLFHAGLALVFLVVDIALISLVAIEGRTAMLLTAIGLALFYLPLRGYIWSRVIKNRRIDETELFQAVIATGLKPSGQARAKSWVALLQDVFKPLNISMPEQAELSVRLSSDGSSLFIPSIGEAPCLELSHKHDGRALFSPRDQALAAQIVNMVQQVDSSRNAYDRGALEERSRIARDIHDNIGAQLLQALHSHTPNRKDDMIRDTLADLREVINNTGAEGLSLSDMLADLRAETSERLSANQINLDWETQGLGTIELPQTHIHALRSVIREAVSNTIRHSGADQQGIQIAAKDAAIHLDISDNGQVGKSIKGSKPSKPGGHGLKNMRARIEALGGTFDIRESSTGVHITAHLELEDSR